MNRAPAGQARTIRPALSGLRLFERPSVGRHVSARTCADPAGDAYTVGALLSVPQITEFQHDGEIA